MLKKHIKSVIKGNLNFVPTFCQENLIEKLSEYIASDEPDVIFLVKGYAGTGKTTIIGALVNALSDLKFNSVLMAPTGRAAKVLSAYSGFSAFTIHKIIFRQKTSADGTGRFVLDRNFHRNTFFIADEASMINNESAENSIFGSGKLLDDLIEYVYSGSNCRLLLVGDTAQLPPVGLDNSPALAADVLSDYGFGVIENELNEVIRQETDSGILFNATKIRQLISEDSANYGFFKLELNKFADIERVSGNDLIEKMEQCYSKYGNFETIIVTRSNKRANQYNSGIRKSILYREDEIARGDILMVVKNNYFWVQEGVEIDFIANGDIAEVVEISGYENMYGFRFAKVLLRFIDYGDTELRCKIFLDTLMLGTASFSADENHRLFEAVAEDYPEVTNKKKRWEKIRENPYFNALQVKFAYAVTCHKAQGGQWKVVFIDHGFITEEMINREFMRWLYTAFTRAVEKLYLVNFNKNFFDSGESHPGMW